jgi:hypothetical protein
MVHIVRLDGKHYSGWQVRAGPRDAQKTVYFSDKKYGGREAAEAAAKQALSDIEAKAPPVRPKNGPRANKQANNKSGVVGVRPAYRRGSKQSENTYLYIQASWSEGGIPCCAAYSTTKHGLLEAVRLALEARAKGTKTPVELTPRQAWERMRHLVTERG